MPSGFDRNYGRVKRLYPTSDRVFFSLMGGETAMNPNAGYYFIKNDHSNYNALVALLYMVANSRLTIKVRTAPNLVGGYAKVQYLVVDW